MHIIVSVIICLVHGSCVTIHPPQSVVGLGACGIAGQESAATYEQANPGAYVYPPKVYCTIGGGK